MDKRIVGLSLFLALVFFSSAVYAGTVEEYSADMVTVPDGKVMQKMYVTPEKMRFDIYDQAGKLQTISILRLDQGKMYALQADSKTYFEIPVNKEFTSFEDLAKGMMGTKFNTSREKQGEEEVGGYAAEKFKVTTTVEVMEQKTTMVHNEWLAPEFAPLPVRTENPGDKTITEMQNIKAGAQDDALFEIPAGYNKDTTMEEMMKNMGQTGQ